jgi:hypothetical protein
MAKKNVENVDNVEPTDEQIVGVEEYDDAVDEPHQEEEVEEKEKPEKKDKDAEKREKIDAVKSMEKTVYDSLKNKDYQNLMSNCYTEMDVNVQMVLDKISYGAIVEGKGGTGKTFRILNQCISALDDNEERVAYADSFTTPTALYVWLYENRDKDVLILDDCAGLMENAKILAMLKGALWHINDGQTRLLTYMTTKPPKDEYDEPLPRSFEINARIIIITNYLNEDSPHVKAVLSRVNKVVVEVPRTELLLILEQVIKRPYHKLDYAERNETLEYLRGKTDNKTEDLNIRTLLRMMDYRYWAKKNNMGEAWKPLSLKLLEKEPRMAMVEKLLNDPTFESEEERIDRYVELTGESRPTWYRWKKKVEKQLKLQKKMEEKNGTKPEGAIPTPTPIHEKKVEEPKVEEAT